MRCRPFCEHIVANGNSMNIWTTARVSCEMSCGAHLLLCHKIVPKSSAGCVWWMWMCVFNSVSHFSATKWNTWTSKIMESNKRIRECKLYTLHTKVYCVHAKITSRACSLEEREREREIERASHFVSFVIPLSVCSCFIVFVVVVFLLIFSHCVYEWTIPRWNFLHMEIIIIFLFLFCMFVARWRAVDCSPFAVRVVTQKHHIILSMHSRHYKIVKETQQENIYARWNASALWMVLCMLHELTDGAYELPRNNNTIDFGTRCRAVYRLELPDVLYVCACIFLSFPFVS